MIHPEVSVIMAVYNAENYLSKAIESILFQSFKNFEFIIINDASNDRSREIINSFDDNRIKLIDNTQNIGLTKSLNKALNEAKGKYIARMDADDISHKERLKIQYNFLEKNKDIGICGTWLKTFGTNNRKIKFPTKHEDVLIYSFYQCPFGHPSVMIRQDIFEINNFRYNETMKYSQDYELWTRVLRKTRGINIPKYLVYYREHSNQISQINNVDQNKVIESTYDSNLRHLLKENYSNEFSRIHIEFMMNYNSFTKFEFSLLDQWKFTLLNANAKQQIYDLYKFTKAIHLLEFNIKKQYYYHTYISKPDIKQIKYFISSSDRPYSYFKITTIISLILKSIRNYIFSK